MLGINVGTCNRDPPAYLPTYLSSCASIYLSLFSSSIYCCLDSVWIPRYHYRGSPSAADMGPTQKRGSFHLAKQWQSPQIDKPVRLQHLDQQPQEPITCPRPSPEVDDYIEGFTREILHPSGLDHWIPGASIASHATTGTSFRGCGDQRGPG